MSILSIQSHVAYGYVGNKAAVYPLQAMGYDVIPVNTVQFSNHTGYGRWQGEIFSRDHVHNVIEGLIDLGFLNKCQAVLSGYMGSLDICLEVYETVNRLKALNKNILYLCDPVIGNTSCYVKPEVLDFFKNNLKADIITPNHFEAETLSDMKIREVGDLKRICEYFHSRDIGIVIITGLKLYDLSENDLYVFISDRMRNINIMSSNKLHAYAIKTTEYDFPIAPNGTGDLFSALFLGAYLKTKDSLKSLQIAVSLIDEVMKNTFNAGERELQVISSKYDINDEVTKSKREIVEISL